MTERESRRTRRRSRTWPRVPHHGSRQRRGQYNRGRLRIISIDASGRRNDHGGARGGMGLWRTLGRSRFARSIAPACDRLIMVSEARGWDMGAYHGV